ncbi:hypothetical protein C8Q75DRAFT_175178 [Abortiporus biennis]|nr:hypothetical protein C8Q75DRAFT_175178 [Abortiporus biennis]
MFFSVARLRLPFLASLLFSAGCEARDKIIFASSVSYCSPPEVLLVQQFDIAFFPTNSSVSFNVSAASVLPNINVTANLLLNVYGMQPLNFTIDLCGVFNGALCPLPTYNFTGADSLKLPSSIHLDIPGIAYVIPDLEAFAQLMLTDAQTGKVRACVQSTLSNGWSARQKSVEWTTGGVALFALFSAMIYSLSSTSIVPIRFLDMINLFQTIAASALFSVNYPSVYRAYALNFSWALGLFPTSPTAPMQKSIDNMRRLTGGNPTDEDGNVISLVNRELSPYNVPVSNLVSKFTPSNFFRSVFASNTSQASPQVLATGESVATVTEDSGNILQAGIPIYVNSVGVSDANAFTTIYFILLILVAIMLVLSAAVLLVRKYLWRRSKTCNDTDERRNVIDFVWSWWLRLAFVAFLPFSLFSFYQWTLEDAWLPIFLSVITLLSIAVAFNLPLVLAVRRNGFSSGRAVWNLYSMVIAYLRPSRELFAVLYLFVIFVRALVTAFAKSHGMVQAVIILVCEVLLFVSLLVLKPYQTRRADVFAGYLCLTRIVCVGLTIAFVESLQLKPIPRVVIGIVMAIIFSVSVVIMILNFIYSTLLWMLVRLFRGNNHQSSSDESLQQSEESTSKGSLGDKIPFMKSIPSDLLKRPTNPSPTHTPTTGTLSVPDTAFSGGFTSTSPSTLGEPLPRRWSFQLSPPPSTSNHSHLH